MGVKSRVSWLMASDIGRLIGEAEEPEAAVAGLIGEIEESIIELRREMVIAIARQNRLRHQLFEADETAGTVERKASLALARGDELRARHLVGREMGALKARDDFEAELGEADRVSARLVAALIRMEDQAQQARRAQDGLMRRRRADDPATDRVGAAGLERGRAFDGYAEAVATLEREASRAEGPEGGGRC